METILGSHNSWSYLPPKKWWMWPFSFMSRCQNRGIAEQYGKYGVRCFDLRVRFNKKNELVMAHGFFEYKYSRYDLFKDLAWLNENGCALRILHEARTKGQYTEESVRRFRELCAEIEVKFPNLKMWCGRNMYDWAIDYDFPYKPTCEEKYSSVCPPKYIDDWYPWIYARLNNGKIKKTEHKAEILLIDYVNIG